MTIENRRNEIPTEEILASLKYLKNPKDIEYRLSSTKESYFLNTSGISMDAQSHRLFMIGNEHSEIYKFMKVLNYLRSDLKPPLTVTNFDQHIDDSGYRPEETVNGLGLNASWQRYFSEIGLTQYESSFNVLPFDDAIQMSSFVKEMGVNQYSKMVHSKGIGPQILSVEMDFFNEIRLHDQIGRYSTQIMAEISEKAEAVMLFLSPAFTYHKNAIEIASKIFKSVIKTPINPK